MTVYIKFKLNLAIKNNRKWEDYSCSKKGKEMKWKEMKRNEKKRKGKRILKLMGIELVYIYIVGVRVGIGVGLNINTKQKNKKNKVEVSNILSCLVLSFTICVCVYWRNGFFIFLVEKQNNFC